MPSPNNRTQNDDYDELFDDDLEEDTDDDDVEIKLEGELREPRSTTYSAWNLYEMMHDNMIDLDPEYQRDVVWPVAAQSKIIESWMKRFHVPPILFRLVEERDGERRICIDGKQRLTSLKKFFNGELPYIDEGTKKKFYFKINVVEGNTRKTKPLLLPPHLMIRIKNKQIRCEEYSDITEEQERALFERVQRGMALSPAEKLQSNIGPWPKFIKDIKERLLLPEGHLLAVVSLYQARAAVYGNVARLVYLIHHLSSDNSHPRPPGEALLRDWLHRTVEPTKQFKDRVRHVMQVYENLAADESHSKTAFCSTWELDPNNPSSRLNSRYSPAEFVLTGVLIALHPHLHMYKLAKAIRDFRTELHQQYATEKKFNQKVFNLFWSMEEKLGDEGKERVGEKRKHGEVVSDSEVEDGEEYEPPLNIGRERSTDRQMRAANVARPLKQSRPSKPSSKPSSSRSVITPITEFQDLGVVGRTAVFGPPTGSLAK